MIIFNISNKNFNGQTLFCGMLTLGRLLTHLYLGHAYSNSFNILKLKHTKFHTVLKKDKIVDS